jgi:hypothetical protein
MFGQKPGVAHVRVFGCKGILHTRKAESYKCDPVGEVCMMIVCAESNKDWKVLVVRGEKLRFVQSTNIRFNKCTASRIRAVLPAEKLPIEPERAHDDNEMAVHAILKLCDIHVVDSITSSKNSVSRGGEKEDGVNVDAGHLSADLVSSKEDAEMSGQHVQGAETDNQDEISMSSNQIVEEQVSGQIQAEDQPERR